MKKEISIIMLPTEKASHIYLNIITNNLGYVSGKHPEDLEQFPQKHIITQNQHLYFLSDDEIQRRDFIIYCSNIKKVFIAEKEQLYFTDGTKAYRKYCKKVIATTDESLTIKKNCNCFATTYEGCSECLERLPKPSNEFLKKFCELGGIDKVMVEYEKESYNDRFTTTENGIGNPETWGNRYNLKIAPDNTITIYPIES